jgi:hypothetical protein
MIMTDKKTRDKMIQNGLQVVKTISSDIMEEKEKELYLNIIKKKNEF